MISLHRIAKKKIFFNAKGQTENPWSSCGRITFLHKPMLEDAANDPLMIPKEKSEQR
jgi:hypothetical protein